MLEVICVPASTATEKGTQEYVTGPSVRVVPASTSNETPDRPDSSSHRPRDLGEHVFPRWERSVEPGDHESRLAPNGEHADDGVPSQVCLGALLEIIELGAVKPEVSGQLLRHGERWGSRPEQCDDDDSDDHGGEGPDDDHPLADRLCGGGLFQGFPA